MWGSQTLVPLPTPPQDLRHFWCVLLKHISPVQSKIHVGRIRAFDLPAQGVIPWLSHWRWTGARADWNERKMACMDQMLKADSLCQLKKCSRVVAGYCTNQCALCFLLIFINQNWHLFCLYPSTFHLILQKTVVTLRDLKEHLSCPNMYARVKKRLLLKCHKYVCDCSHYVLSLKH